jgi:hypothetical protein
LFLYFLDYGSEGDPNGTLRQFWAIIEVSLRQKIKETFLRIPVYIHVLRIVEDSLFPTLTLNKSGGISNLLFGW